MWPNEAQELLRANVLKPAVRCCQSCQITLALFGEQVIASCFQLAWKAYSKGVRTLSPSAPSSKASEQEGNRHMGWWRTNIKTADPRGQAKATSKRQPSHLLLDFCLLCRLSQLPVALGMLSWCHSGHSNSTATKINQAMASLYSIWARNHLLLHHCPGPPCQNM